MTLFSIALGVNIDHVATLRQARGGSSPDPLHAALLAEQAGADSITLHLREDRRHIQDRDVLAMRDALQTRMNLEMAVTDEMLAIACRIRRPTSAWCRSGGRKSPPRAGWTSPARSRVSAKPAPGWPLSGIRVSLFIDPDESQIDAATRSGAPAIELHTGAYAEASGPLRAEALHRLAQAARQASAAGLVVNAGHGLDYHNVQPVAALPQLVELNIGHAIVARAVFTGLGAAVAEMKRLMREARAA